jgi:hypothetical protein
LLQPCEMFLVRHHSALLRLTEVLRSVRQIRYEITVL